MRQVFNWKLRSQNLLLGESTIIMGILNITPDSFSKDGCFNDVKVAVDKALQFESEGADIIDIGGESTRPGAYPITAEEELSRVIPVIQELRKYLKIPISVDTYRSEVAEVALKNGAEIINDISGLRADKKLAEVIVKNGAGLVIMNSYGKPGDLHSLLLSGDVTEKVKEGLFDSVQIAINAGVNKNQIVIDPGIGFGKTVEGNLLILKQLSQFTTLGLPLLIGTSRKSFIGKITNQEIPVERIWGTAATVVVAVMNGAHIVRVHDVSQMKDCLKIVDEILRIS